MWAVSILILSLLVSLAARADYALVHEGRVVQIAPDKFPVHPSLEWIDLTNVNPKPQAGWTYNGTFSAPAAIVPPSEPTVAGGRFKSDPALKAIVRGLAEQKGMTEAQVIEWLKNKL